MKLIIVGDVESTSNAAVLLNRLTKLQGSGGGFDLVLCAGNIDAEALGKHQANIL